LTRITAAWKALVHWFEFGDLLPLLIIVSAAHYIAILSDHDYWPVAVAIGILVDLGHYRWVRAAARYTGGDKRQLITRWLFAILLTVISFAYHQRFYQDYWLSIPLPLLIASLAWLGEVDKRIGKRLPAEQSETKPQAIEPPTKPSEPDPQPEPQYICSCGYVAKSQNALNAHNRKHAR